MKKFLIQIEPHRSPDLDAGNLLSQFEGLSDEMGWVRKRSVEHGFDKQPYVHLLFETDHPKLFWEMLREKIDQPDAYGPSMRAASFVICEGKAGWNDYVMLHHYDPDISCEPLLE